MTPPRRFKTIEELTPAEHAERQRTGTLPETDAYREARSKALADAGLEQDDSGRDLESLTADDHARRKYGDAA